MNIGMFYSVQCHILFRKQHFKVSCHCQDDTLTSGDMSDCPNVKDRQSFQRLHIKKSQKRNVSFHYRPRPSDIHAKTSRRNIEISSRYYSSLWFLQSYLMLSLNGRLLLDQDDVMSDYYVSLWMLQSYLYLFASGRLNLVRPLKPHPKHCAGKQKTLFSSAVCFDELSHLSHTPYNSSRNIDTCSYYSSLWILQLYIYSHINSFHKASTHSDKCYMQCISTKILSYSPCSI